MIGDSVTSSDSDSHGDHHANRTISMHGRTGHDLAGFCYREKHRSHCSVTTNSRCCNADMRHKRLRQSRLFDADNNASALLESRKKRSVVDDGEQRAESVRARERESVRA